MADAVANLEIEKSDFLFILGVSGRFPSAMPANLPAVPGMLTFR